MDNDQIWDVITAQRRELEEILRSLPAASWERESLCAGWKISDVAAHVISAPQLNVAVMLKVIPAMIIHGYNGATLRDGQRRGAVGPQEILSQYRRFASVPRGPAMVGVLETLTDTLVHTQDIVRPLGIRYDMPLPAAELVARRLEKTGWLLGSRRIIREVRMEVNDWEFASGSGPVLRGPLAELVMLRAGRRPDWSQLSGPGVRIASEK